MLMLVRHVEPKQDQQSYNHQIMHISICACSSCITHPTHSGVRIKMLLLILQHSPNTYTLIPPHALKLCPLPCSDAFHGPCSLVMLTFSHMTDVFIQSNLQVVWAPSTGGASSTGTSLQGTRRKLERLYISSNLGISWYPP